jgi:hypothetical protein
MPGKIKTGSYAGATTPSVQGKGTNKTVEHLRSMELDGANAGAALRKAAPVGAGSYEDFQKNRHTPQGQAEKEAYEVANKLPRLSDADYQQRRFDQSVSTLAKKATVVPDSSLFSGAPTDAAYAAQRSRSLTQGNYADTGNAAATTASLADRSSKMQVDSAYAAPGMGITPAPKDMGGTTPMAKKMSLKPVVAKYADGTKKIAASPFSEVDSEGEDEMEDPVYNGSPNPNSQAFIGPPREGDTDASSDTVAAKADTTIKTLDIPTTKKMALGPKAPSTYKQAAKAIQADKALLAKYHAGVASGKAFSLNVGGKAFKYAATPKTAAKEVVTGLPGGDIRKARMQEADEMSQVEMMKRRKIAVPAKGTITNAKTTPLQLGEDAENAALRKQVRKMSLKA